MNFFVDKPNIAAAPGPNGNDLRLRRIRCFRRKRSGKAEQPDRVCLVDRFGGRRGPRLRSRSASRCRGTRHRGFSSIRTTLWSFTWVGGYFLPSQTGGWTNAIVGKRSNDGGADLHTILPYPVAPLLKPFDQPQVAPAPPRPFRSLGRTRIPRRSIDGNGAIHIALQEYVYPANYPLAALRGLPLAAGREDIRGRSRASR